MRVKRQRYAKESSVPVSKTRAEIEKLLRNWGCKKVGFLDHYDEQRVEIQFIWFDDEDNPYAARYTLNVKPIPALGERKSDCEVRGRWRALFYWLRSAIGAVDAGIIQPEEIFLPWVLTGSGQTVSEVLLPQLKELSAGSAMHLLGAGEGAAP